MLRLTLPTLLVWLVFVFAADLSSSVAVSGVVVACILGWWETQQRLAASADEVEYVEEFEDEADEPFAREAPIYYV